MPEAINTVFHIPQRYMRSIELERDFRDPHALDDYIVTQAMTDAFHRITDGLRPESGRRAWRITGDYGVGKSSFALMLASLLSNRGSQQVERVAGTIGWVPDSSRSFWPVLVTGAREGIAAAVLRGLSDCIAHHKPKRGPASKAWTNLAAMATDAVWRSDIAAMNELLAATRTLAAANGHGVLLIVDELGKLLEFAAQSDGREDVFVLQQLAEAAARSSDQPFLFVGLLHQGFHAYAERLPAATRHEWDKVAGRFEEIVFDQPLAHTAALVAGALGVQTSKLGRTLVQKARTLVEATAAMGWLSGGTSSALLFDAAPLYPVHPTLLPILVRFFARYGQHERSLFGFLLSSEPFGLQSFAERPAAADAWYGLPEFYDYVRSVYGHRLVSAAAYSHWLRITETVSSASVDLDPVEVRLLKAVAVLNLLDCDDLLPTDSALRACLAPIAANDVNQALTELDRKQLLFNRGKQAGYRLWPHSSVNLREMLEDARRQITELDSVAGRIEAFLEREPVLARRHYLRRGTMRYFELRYATPDRIEQVLRPASQTDGIVLIALADVPAQVRQIATIAAGADLADRRDLVIGALPPLGGIAAELRELLCWQWIADHRPELAQDSYAAAEVGRQVVQGRRALKERLTLAAALRGRPNDLNWFHRGRLQDAGTGLPSLLSTICDALFEDAPRITNELLNRNALSSPASAARMRLIEGLFRAADRPLLGIDPDRAPPEKSMYLSVIHKGGLHRETADGWEIVLPDANDDPLNLKPAIDLILKRFEEGLGRRINVASLLQELSRPPYGVRAGVAPLLLALILKARAHELAVYENGTFRAGFGDQEFMRLIKAPANFEIQHCRLEGVRSSVFARLAQTFATQVTDKPNILDVVVPLVRFAAELPDYTRKAGALSSQANAIRSALLSASEPSTLLFRDLPAACELPPFPMEIEDQTWPADQFIDRLRSGIEELRSDYPRLLCRLIETVAHCLGEDHVDRALLASRAARVALVAREPRLRAFAMRLRDIGTSQDSWMEALASFAISKTPQRWSRTDEQLCNDTLSGLIAVFVRAEAAAFDSASGETQGEAVRINLTRADGQDRMLIIADGATFPTMERDLDALRDHLPQGRNVRIRLLTQLLWDDLATVEARTQPGGDKDQETKRA